MQNQSDQYSYPAKISKIEVHGQKTFQLEFNGFGFMYQHKDPIHLKTNAAKNLAGLIDFYLRRNQQLPTQITEKKLKQPFKQNGYFFVTVIFKASEESNEKLFIKRELNKEDVCGTNHLHRKSPPFSTRSAMC